MRTADNTERKVMIAAGCSGEALRFSAIKMGVDKMEWME